MHVFVCMFLSMGHAWSGCGPPQNLHFCKTCGQSDVSCEYWKHLEHCCIVGAGGGRDVRQRLNVNKTIPLLKSRESSWERVILTMLIGTVSW